MTSDPTDFGGKFRGTVHDNNDPLRRARLQVVVPDVLGPVASTWAEPSLPMTAPQAGVFALPPVGASVWVEFEQGDPRFPVWSGGRWESSDDVPSRALNEDPDRQNILLQTTGGQVVLLSDTPGSDGGIHLENSSGTRITVSETTISLTNTGGASITVDANGITLDNGSGARIALVGPQVDINDGGLTVV